MNVEEAPVATTSGQRETAAPVVSVADTATEGDAPQAQGLPKRALVEHDSRSPTPEPLAIVLAPEVQPRETEPVAGPSRTVVEPITQDTREEPVPAVTIVPQHSEDTEPRRGDQADSNVPTAKGDVALPSDTATAVTEDRPATTEAPPKKKRKRQRENIPEPVSTRNGQSSSRRHATPVNNDADRPPTATTPLRQEIERNNEKRRREQHRQVFDQGPSARRLSKRAASPDKVYAYVNLPPPRPAILTLQEPEAISEPQRRRTPPRELTPAEREQSVQAGGRIVQDIAAQYRLKVAALGKRFGVGIKEISAATSEVKRRNGGKSAVDWSMLETVLQEQYGR